MDMAEVLAANGWLTPIEGRQYNEKMWRVVRGSQMSQMSPDTQPARLSESAAA